MTMTVIQRPEDELGIAPLIMALAPMAMKMLGGMFGGGESGTPPNPGPAAQTGATSSAGGIMGMLNPIGSIVNTISSSISSLASGGLLTPKTNAVGTGSTVVFCPQGQMANPTWMGIPAEMRAQAAASGIQACIPNGSHPGAAAPGAAGRPGPVGAAGYPGYPDRPGGGCLPAYTWTPATGMCMPGAAAGARGPKLGRRAKRGSGSASRSRSKLHGLGMPSINIGEIENDLLAAADGGFLQRHSTALLIGGAIFIAAGVGIGIARSGGNMQRRRRRYAA